MHESGDAREFQLCESSQRINEEVRRSGMRVKEASRIGSAVYRTEGVEDRGDDGGFRGAVEDAAGHTNRIAAGSGRSEKIRRRWRA